MTPHDWGRVQVILLAVLFAAAVALVIGRLATYG